LGEGAHRGDEFLDPGWFRPWLTERIEILERVGRALGRNWQVIVAGLIYMAAVWMWIVEQEKDIASGRWTPELYVRHARKRMGLAEKLPLPQRAGVRAQHLVEALDGLENLETIHGIEDTPDLWRSAEYMARIRRDLALLKRDYPDDVREIVERPARDLLVRSVSDYSSALGMESPTPEDRRRLNVGFADALSDLGQHTEVVEVLSPIVRELRRDEVDRLLRMKDGNEIPVLGEGAGDLTPFETRVHMTLARSLGELGRLDEARRHYALISVGGAGADSWRARLQLGDLAATAALSGSEPDAAGLERAARYYGQVQAGAASDERRFEAAMRLGATLLVAGRPLAAADVFAEAAKGREDEGGMSAELMRAVGLVRHAASPASPVSRADRPAALETASEVLKSLTRTDPVGPHGAAAKVILGDVLLVKKDLAGAWEVYSAIAPYAPKQTASRHDRMPEGLPGLESVLRAEGMVERLSSLAAEYSAVREHQHAIDALVKALDAWAADPRVVRPKIAAEADRYAAELAEEVDAASTDAGRNRAVAKRRTWVLRAADEYLSIATRSPKSEAQARALLVAAERFKTADGFLKAADAYRLFAESFSDDPAASRALLELGGCLQKVGKYPEAALAFRENIRKHPREPYGYLSHFEWGHSLMMWGKLSGDVKSPVEPAGKRPLGAPPLVLGARQVFERILADARYSPESFTWMRSLVKLGQVYVLLGDEESARAIDDPGREEAAGELYRRAVAVLTEALERYPLEKYKALQGIQPAFYEFLWDEEMATTEALAMAHVGLAQHREALRYLIGLRGQIEEQAQLSDQDSSKGLSPREKSFYLYTGLCHYRLGLSEEDEEKARAHFREALRYFTQARDKLLQEPESPWVRHGMALCYERLGELDAAARAYRDAAWAYQNVPGEPLAPEGLGRDFWLKRNKRLREALEWKVKARGEKEMM